MTVSAVSSPIIPSTADDRVRIPNRTEKVNRSDFWGRVIVPLNKAGHLTLGRQDGIHRWVLKENQVTDQVFDLERIRASRDTFVLVETGTGRSFVLTGSSPPDLADELFRHR